eukprot:tig00001420_g8687.t1
MDLVIKTRSGKELGRVSVPDSATVEQLKKAISEKTKVRVGPARQRLTLPTTAGQKPISLARARALTSPPPDIVFKDLGPQIGYQTVFFWEYFGPLIVYLGLYLGREQIYGSLSKDRNVLELQTWAMGFWVAHFGKRILETFFVHRFSKGTMPLFNLFKNSSYYWGAGLLVGYFVNHPLYMAPRDLVLEVGGRRFFLAATDRIHFGAAMWVVCELLNFVVHVQLRNLRPPGSKERKIPRGILFCLISCPNYTFEILAWLAFNIMTQTLGGVIFMTVGAIQMAIWASDKHRAYKRDFGKEYPRIRYRIFPFLF